MTIVAGILRWTVAILSVAGTVALVGWTLYMIFKKDKRDDVPR